ncbi:MAG: triose-phosphate isomerase [Bergeyella sp.]|nr:triose-phosphate isomerase [Bergeyella sp.]
MRKNIVAGNWKMNKTFPEAEKLMKDLLAYKSKESTHCQVSIVPPSIYLSLAREIFKNKEVGLFSQDVSKHSHGAYTGEISAAMLQSMQLDGSLVAHSERRAYHRENDTLAKEKINALLAAGLRPIYCNGESLEERKAGKHLEVVKKQTETALFGLSEEEIKKVIIAYEPVWAIGTGETASPNQAQEIHSLIRNLIAEKYGRETAEEISILYGGSVKPDNAKEIFSKPDVDGGLIGGASLVLEDFIKIIQAFD